MPRKSNTITIEVDNDTTIEIIGTPRTGRCDMTVHQVVSRKEKTTTATLTSFRLDDQTKRSLVDALEMMR